MTADIQSLKERAKELRCLYAIDSIVSDRSQPPVRVFERVLREIPAGWQDPGSTAARIEYLGRAFLGAGFAPDSHRISAPIRLWAKDIGRLCVSRRVIEPVTAPPFLDEEVELLRRIAARLGEFLEWKHAEMLGQQAPPASFHWAWRQRLAEALADAIDTERFNVSRVFVGGSTARGDAGPASDIDLYILFHGPTPEQNQLAIWLDGWSRCLAEVALQQTGQHFPDGVLNVQWLDAEPDLRHRAELQELKLRPPRAPRADRATLPASRS